MTIKPKDTSVFSILKSGATLLLCSLPPIIVNFWKEFLGKPLWPWLDWLKEQGLFLFLLVPVAWFIVSKSHREKFLNEMRFFLKSFPVTIILLVIFFIFVAASHMSSTEARKEINRLTTDCNKLEGMLCLATNGSATFHGGEVDKLLAAAFKNFPNAKTPDDRKRLAIAAQDLAGKELYLLSIEFFKRAESSESGSDLNQETWHEFRPLYAWDLFRKDQTERAKQQLDFTLEDFKMAKQNPNSALGRSMLSGNQPNSDVTKRIADFRASALQKRPEFYNDQFEPFEKNLAKLLAESL